MSALALMLTACFDSPDRNPGAPPLGDPEPGQGPGEAAALIATSDGTARLNEWQTGDVALGARAMTTVFLTNAGDAPTKALQLSLGGANASEFSINAAQSTCSNVELAAGAQCHVGLVFAPAGTATGARAARLDVLGAASGLAIELHGNATPAASGLVVDMASLDLGPTQLQHDSVANVVVSNTGTTSLGLSRPNVTGESSFEVAAFDCGASLAPAASCTITVQFAPTRPGAAIGTLVIPSSADTATVQLAGVGERRVVVTWAGSGAVTAVPNNLTCQGTECAGLFPGDVTLTATPAAGSDFAGWSPLCGANPACTLPVDASPEVQLSASFTMATGPRQVTIAMPGPAPGVVFFTESEGVDDLPPCFATCTVSITPGSHLVVSGFTPSMFAGWTAPGCAADPTTHDCDLGAITGNVTASASFQRDDRELTTIIPRAIVTGLGFAPDGNLIVADAQGVSKLRLDGSAVWSVAMAHGARDLAIDAAGRIYGASLTGGGVFALAADGSARWTRADVTASQTDLGIGAYASNVAASPDGTVIAVQEAHAIAVLDGAGVDRFTVPESTAISGLAVAPDDTVGFGIDAGGFLALQRFDASGNQLASPASPLSGNTSAALAYDSTANLAAYIGGFGSETVSLSPPLSDPAFVVTEHTSEGNPIATAVGFDGAGNVVAARGLFADKATSGLRVELFSRTGSNLWLHEKTGPLDLFFGLIDDQVTPAALATDGGRRIAFGGEWGEDFLPWIQVYEMPAGQ